MTLGLPLSTLWAFLLVLARVSGFITFFPVPGFRAVPDFVRVVLSLAITVALFPVWPILPDTLPSVGQLTAWAFCEAGFGLVVGLAIAFLLEGFQLAGQIIGLQAGYGYSQTIDPTSQADSGVLQVMLSLSTGLMFFTLGLDRQFIRILAASFEKFPAGAWAPVAQNLDGIVKLGGAMFTTGLALAMPMIALLMVIDVALALLGRMQQQLQLLSLAFPVKMLAALALLAAMAPVLPKIFGAAADRTLSALWRGMGF
jgi:flagellar biosynthetic protein FliR